MATRSGRTPASRAKPTRAASTASKLPAPIRRPAAFSSARALTAAMVRRGSSPQLEVLRYVTSGANSAAAAWLSGEIVMRPAWSPRVS
ncbi:hypothetical protein SMICM17S_12121 [Streptomyces microflavus]